MQVITGATLIDGTGAPPLDDAAVLIDGERIAAVGTRQEVTWPANSEVLDASGLTLMPGLIDCHDHLATHSYEPMHRFGLDEPRSTRHLRTARAIEQTLATGYTALREAGGLDAGFKRAVEEGLIAGPRLVLALSIMSSTGGIGDVVSGSGHGRLLPPDPALPSGVADGVDAVRSVVRTLARAGADVIKCATTGGASSRPGHGPFDPAFGRDEMEALVAEAHALDRPVVCHALGGDGLRVAVEAGVDSIEHGCYLADEPELIARMADRGTFFVPTLTVYEFHRESQSPHVRERALALQRPHTESIQRALAAGVHVVAGTDAGGHEHGINAREIVLLEQAGLTPMQAIQAATGWAAECLGLGSEIGTVEPGKLADMIAVGGNPLEDIAVLEDHQRIALVIKGGTVHVDRRGESQPTLPD